jgi:citrate synthase
MNPEPLSMSLSWLSSSDAARSLGVRRSTLYAYVSRGLLRSQVMPGGSRARGYSREDVERLRRRTEAHRHPDQAAERALQWGLPVLESSIALIDGQRLYYRGHDAVMLARSRSLEDVASLVWTGRFEGAVPAGRVDLPARAFAAGDGLSFVARAQSALARASSRDPLAFDLRPASAAIVGWRILDVLTQAAAGSGAHASTIDETLARAWGLSRRGGDLLRSALILCADHELNVSAFTARCVASAGSSLYAVVIAALAALEGTKHGGASARVEAMLQTSRRARDLPGSLAGRLRRGEPIEGFGHPLYRHGDPRAAALLDLLRARDPKSSELAFVSAFRAAAVSVTGEQPTIDFALAALARALRLPPGSPLTIFAIGRAIGWIGHAIEQYATGQLIRPRAKYVGIAPGSSAVQG